MLHLFYTDDVIINPTELNEALLRLKKFIDDEYRSFESLYVEIDEWGITGEVSSSKSTHKTMIKKIKYKKTSNS